LLFLASTAFASEGLLKCRWVATGVIEGRLKLVESKEFEFPVDTAKGLFHYLENGMEDRQKEVLAKAGKEFLKQVEQLKSKGEVSAPIGFQCRDEKTREGVVLLYFREF
jgi:hypothetical protein